MIVLTRLLLVDDILLFGEGTTREWIVYNNTLEIFFLAIGMEVNVNKSHIFLNEVSQ